MRYQYVIRTGRGYQATLNSGKNVNLSATCFLPHFQSLFLTIVFSLLSLTGGHYRVGWKGVWMEWEDGREGELGLVLF